jgi:hypothetical protein
MMGDGPQPAPASAPSPAPAPSQSTGGGQYYSDGRGKANDYQPAPAIQSAWPASFAGGGFSVNRDGLRQVSSALKQDVAEIQAVCGDLQANGLVTELQVGEWDAPSGLAGATSNAFAGITSFVNDLIQAQNAVSERLSKSANAYSDTEANNVALSNGVHI